MMQSPYKVNVTFTVLSERKILARHEENLMFEEASLCAAIETLRTDEFVMCPVCKRCVVRNKIYIFCHKFTSRWI